MLLTGLHGPCQYCSQAGYLLQRPPEQVLVRDVLALGDPRQAVDGPEGPLWSEVRKALAPGKAALEGQTLAELCPTPDRPTRLSIS